MALEKLDSKAFVLHLSGHGMSGRGVKFKLLSPSEKRKVDTLATQLLPKDLPKEQAALEFFRARLREGVKAFLLEVTDNHSLPTLTPTEKQPKPQWHKLSRAEIDVADNDYHLESGLLFTTADIETLEAIYRNYHEPTQEQVNTALGEAMPAS